MNPWWLKPPAEDGPANDQKPRKPASKPEKQPKVELPEEESAAPEKRRSGRGRGSRRRRGSTSRGRPKARAQRRIAVFCDAAAVVAGLDRAGSTELDLKQALGRLSERGQIIARRAYGDWSRLSGERERFAGAGVEAVETPGGDAPQAALQLAVDAVELCVADEPCETFVVMAESADYLPLVIKLRENGAEVVGVGVRQSASPELVEACSEYIDLAQPAPAEVSAAPEVDESRAPAFALLVETIEAVQAETEGTLWGSVLKQEMRRRQPQFDETSLGYATFTDLLEDAERHEVILLERDDRSGGYYVAGLPGQ